MPIYEFHCSGCDHDFEELIRSSSDQADITCPECRSSRVEKQWSTFGFSVSGGGGACSGDSCGCDNCRGGTCDSCRH